MKSLIFFCFVTFFIARLEASRFRCDYTYSKEAGGYLKYQEIPASWLEARAKCTLEGAILASPLTPELSKAINRIVNATCPRGIWSGIFSQVSGADYTSVDGVPLSEIPHTWMKCEPDNDQNEERCIVLNSNGELADARCHETLPYVCYKKTVPGMSMTSCGSSDKKYNFEKRTGKCYKFHRIPMDWSQAYITCMAEGGHLAIINNEEESKVLAEIFSKALPSKDTNLVIFIGTQKWNETGEWRTIHGETLEDAGFAKWSPGEPNTPNIQFCGGMYQTGLLDDTTCGKRGSFICEKDQETLMCDHEKKRK